MRFAGTVIANVFLWSSSPFYPDYVALARARGIDAAEDQSLAGAIWMIEGSIVTICVLGWLFTRWMAQGAEAEALVEHARSARDRARSRRGRGGRSRRARARGCAPAWTQRTARPSRTRPTTTAATTIT